MNEISKPTQPAPAGSQAAEASAPKPKVAKPKIAQGAVVSSTADTQRGLLDLSVELSTRDMTAGEEFAIYVLVKNPFTHPVWIDRVHLSLPSELINPKKDEIQRQIKQQVETEVAEIQKDREFYKASLARIERILPGAVDECNLVKKKDDLSAVRAELAQINERLGGAKRSLKFLWFDISVDLTTQQAEKLQKVAATREMDLDSSLSSDMALQPSSTAVFTAVLNVKRPLFRPPSKFRLQISVVYSLAKSGKESSTFSNTIAPEITIRPALKSLLYGAALGGVCGSVGRMLQIGGVNLELITLSSLVSFLLSVVLAVLLSAIAIIFMARKSDAQPFISVEDFWGGLLIGFLVGYTGTSFFSEITHIEPVRPAG